MEEWINGVMEYWIVGVVEDRMPRLMDWVLIFLYSNTPIFQ
jgi:hypothetical protein